MIFNLITQIANYSKKVQFAHWPLKNNNCKQKKEEIGDLFFSVINLTRLLNIDPEICIYEANKKFAKRCEIYFSLKDKKNDRLSKEEDYKLWQLTKKFESDE